MRQTAVACCANLRFFCCLSNSFFLSVFQFFPLSLLNKVFSFRHFWFSCRFILLICFRFHFLSTNSRKLSVRFQFFCPISFSRNFLIKFRQKKEKQRSRNNHYSSFKKPGKISSGIFPRIAGNVLRLDAEAKPANELISAKDKIFSWKIDFNLREIELLRQTAVVWRAKCQIIFSIFSVFSAFILDFFPFSFSFHSCFVSYFRWVFKLRFFRFCFLFSTVRLY